jgi:hypothetical protein
MSQEIIPAFINLGAVGLILWWLTLKLIPQLQKERSEAIAAFQVEMEKERIMHKETLDKLVEHFKWMVETIKT